MSIEKTTAISLGTINFGETSRIVTFLTKDFGLIKCIAKGSRSNKGKFGSALEPFALSNIVFYLKSKQDLFLVSQADIINYFSKIRENLLENSHALVFMELLKKTLLTNEHAKDIFDLTYSFLKNSNDNRQNKDYTNILAKYIIEYCMALGFRLNLTGCATCNTQNDKMFFNLENGYLYCPNCNGDATSDSVTVNYNIIREILLSNPNNATNNTQHSLDIISAFIDYIAHHLGKHINLLSYNFLKSLY